MGAGGWEARTPRTPSPVENEHSHSFIPYTGSCARAGWVLGDRSGLSRATPSLMGCRGPGVAQGKGQGWGCHRRFSRAADISVQ